jgi:hypothetical protein
MDQGRAIASPVDGGRSMQPFVVFFGTSLQFSDQMLRFLGLEFPEVRFERASDQGQAVTAGAHANLIILHEGVPDRCSAIAFPKATRSLA